MNKLAKPNDRTDRLRWLRELKEAIPKSTDQIMPRTLEIWSYRLVRIPMPILVVVANILVERNTFFPALAEILHVCMEVSGRVADRDWKQRLEGWKAEALPQGEAKKLLEAINEKAGVALVPSRGTGMFRLMKQQPKHDPGSELSEEQWEERKSKLKENAGGA